MVLTDKLTGKLRPDGIIPFKIDSASLPKAVRRFYKGKKLLPKGFFSDSTIGQVTGVYAPFWVFNGTLSGQLDFNGENAATLAKYMGQGKKQLFADWVMGYVKSHSETDPTE